MQERLTALIARFRRLWLPLSAGLLVIIYVAFALAYFQQWREQNGLNTQIAQFSAINQQQPGDEELQARLDQAQAEMETAQALFPTDLAQAMLGMSQVLGDLKSQTAVTIAPISDPQVERKSIAGIDYQLLHYTIDVEGDYTKVVDFISGLDAGPASLRSLVLTGVSLEIGTPTAARLDFTVYILSGG